MNRIYGDLLDEAETGLYGAVLQGCNCFNTMGAFLALQIKNRWPEVYAADLRTVKGDIHKLGTYTSAVVERRNARFTVYNLYTQYRYGSPRERHFNPDALRMALMRLRNELSPDTRILSPLIGTGGGGYRWRHVSKIFDEELPGWDITFISLPDSF
jgi:O-acetyl-ADP-ribose deacetylase (regulator of RNase III)